MHIRLLTARIIAVTALSAATTLAASVLGIRYPLGTPAMVNSGSSMSMGGSGAGSDIASNLMLLNPANLGNVRKTVLSSLFLFDFTSIRQDNGGATNSASFNPRQVSFAFPMGAFGTLAGSYEKRQDAKLRYEFTTVSLTDSFQALSSYRQTYAKDGGELAWSVGWGRSIGKYARVGLAYDRVYYRTAEARSMIIDGVYPYVYTDTTEVVFRGNSLRLGAQVPVWHLTLGIAGQYYFPTEASYKQGTYVQVPVFDFAPTSFTLKLPPIITGGIAWQVDPRWQVAFDLNATVWSWYDCEGLLLSAELRDKAFSFHLGGQYVPAPDELTPKYWETICYRLGTNLTQLPASSAYEFGVSAGVGLPLPAGGGLLDLVFEYGQRLDDAYPTYAEHLFRVGVGINGGRKWTKSGTGSY